MSKEIEERYCSDGDCSFASNVVLLSHQELGFWQGVRTRLHLITCDSCKQRNAETKAVRGHLLSLPGIVGSGSELPIRVSRKFIRMQVAIASVVAVASIILAYTGINAYLSEPSVAAKPSSSEPALSVAPKLYGDDVISKKGRKRGQKPRKQSSEVAKSPDFIR